MNKKLSIVIPAAGVGRRMKSYGPKSIIPIGGEPLVCRQLRVLDTLFPDAEKVVVVGFRSERVKRTLPANVRVVQNDHYEETNVAYSVAAGMRACKHDRVLVVYGDLVFDQAALTPLVSCNSSSALFATQEGFSACEVGLNTIDDHVLYFSYGLPTKWAQTMLLQGRERHIFQRLASDPNKSKHFGFEILNLVLEYDETSLAAIPAAGKIVEIDSSRDILSALSIDVQ